MSPDSKHSALDRALGVFADVHPGEGLTAVLLSLNIFLILMAYYVLKPVREALILGEGSAELKSYMSAGQVVLLAFVVPLYGSLVARFVRIRLINVVTAFFVSCLVLFYVLARFHTPLAIVFFLWIGIFNLMVIAQFWSFANDIYTKDQGERLFAIVGFGASLGAVAGSRIADRLIEPVGIYQMMLVGAGILVAQLLITNYLDRRGPGHTQPTAKQAASTPPKTSGSDAFTLVFKTRYLLLMALMLMLLNWVNTTGEYILGSIVKDTVSKTVAAGGAGGLSPEQLIGGFYSKYFTYVNITGLVLQLFVVSRVVKHLGVSKAVMILPVISLGVYNVLIFFPTLNAVLTAKVAENSTDYSINNTVRNMLFLPCTYEEKFSAKQAIDSFFVRMGDVLSAGLVFLGTAVFSIQPRQFALVNAIIVVAWLALAWQVGRRYDSLTEERRHGAAAM
jgi:ATP:ADP antiporter, AAA family